MLKARLSVLKHHPAALQYGRRVPERGGVPEARRRSPHRVCSCSPPGTSPPNAPRSYGNFRVEAKAGRGDDASMLGR